MPKIEDVKRYCEELEKISMTDTGGSVAKITLAAIEYAQGYKKDDDGYWWVTIGSHIKYVGEYENLPAAVRAVLEVTGEKQ